MKVSKAQIKANTRYRQRHFLSLNICFHKDYDSAVVCKLQTTENKTDYIRQLILKDIKGGR